MCYEERYFSEWARRSTRKREEPKPTAERSKPDLKPEPERKPATTPAVEHEVEAG
jgi:hypothetical protein